MWVLAGTLGQTGVINGKASENLKQKVTNKLSLIN